MKILNKIKENKIFFITFGMLMIVSAEYLCQKEVIHYMDNYYYPLYVINYDCGYSSRLLIGAVFSLFFGETLNPYNLIYTLLCIYALVCFCLSLFINNYLKKTKYEPVAVYALFMIVSPSLLSFLRYMGTLDLFWMFLIIGSLWAVNKKGFRWLVPIFCAVSLCIYELFVTTYLPVMAIIVFYQFVKKPNVSNFIYIAVCAVVVGLATIYFLFLGDSTMKMVSDEMVAFAGSRIESPGNNFDEFYLRSVFFWEVPGVENYHGFLGYLQYGFDVFTKRNDAAIKTTGYFLVSVFLTAVPYAYLIAKSFKKSKKALEKFIFICCFSPFPFVVANLFISSDTERFAMHFLLSILFLLLFFINENDKNFSDAYDEAKHELENKKITIAFIGAAAAQIIFSGVRF